MSQDSAERSDTVVVDAMQWDDLEQVFDIELSSFIAPWSPSLFVQEFSNPRSRRIVALERAALPERVVRGYCIFWAVVCDEVHIMSIATDPLQRRRGVGAALLRRVLDDVAAGGGGHVVLEVRVSNVEAQRLYERHGFIPVGVRKNYYQESKEDALLMDCAVAAAQPPDDGPL